MLFADSGLGKRVLHLFGGIHIVLIGFLDQKKVKLDTKLYENSKYHLNLIKNNSFLFIERTWVENFFMCIACYQFYPP